jgi:hypothetical protein
LRDAVLEAGRTAFMMRDRMYLSKQSEKYTMNAIKLNAFCRQRMRSFTIRMVASA